MKLSILNLTLFILTSGVGEAIEVDLGSCKVQDNYNGEIYPTKLCFYHNGVWLVCEGKGKGYKIVVCLNSYKNGITLKEIVGNK